MDEFPTILQAYQPTKSGDAILETRIVFTHLAARLFEQEYPRLKVKEASYPIKVEAWLDGYITRQMMAAKIIQSKEALHRFLNKWQNHRFEVHELSQHEQETIRIPQSIQLMELTEQQRQEIVLAIKERVKSFHSASVIKALSAFRNKQQEINDNFDLRIDQELIHSISMQVIQDQSFDRIKEEKDFVIIFKNNEALAPSGVTIGGDFHGNLNTGTLKGNQSSEIARDSPRMESTSNSNPSKPKTRSWLEILSWIFGIIAGAIAFYEFILKHILHTESLF